MRVTLPVDPLATPPIAAACAGVSLACCSPSFSLLRSVLAVEIHAPAAADRPIGRIPQNPQFALGSAQASPGGHSEGQVQCHRISARKRGEVRSVGAITKYVMVGTIHAPREILGRGKEWYRVQVHGSLYDRKVVWNTKLDLERIDGEKIRGISALLERTANPHTGSTGWIKGHAHS